MGREPDDGVVDVGAAERSSLVAIDQVARRIQRLCEPLPSTTAAVARAAVEVAVAARPEKKASRKIFKSIDSTWPEARISGAA